MTGVGLTETNSFEIYGDVIPYMDREVASRLYPNEPSLVLAGHKIVRVGVQTPERLYAPIAIANMFKPDHGSWHNLLSRYWTVPNGQVKNFLVAIRTYCGGKGKVRICIKGSKAGQGSGSWHTIYAAILSMIDTDVRIDCYDDCELADTKKSSWADHKVEINWIRSKYSGNGSEYDVLIDDAWVPGQGVVVMRPRSEYYSLKGTQSMLEYKPFLHPIETRLFSHMRPALNVPCRCMVCRAISESAHTYRMYEVIRTFCGQFGHRPDCLRMGLAYYEIQVKGDVLKDVLTHPQVTLSRPVEIRAALALSSEIPLMSVGPKTIVHVPTAPIVPLRKEQGEIRITSVAQPKCAWLEGKTVAFIGVDAAYLGSTKTRDTTITAAGARLRIDAAFYASVEALEMNVVSSVAYVPARSKMPVGWVRQQYKWKDHECWEYFPPAKELVPVFKQKTFSVEDLLVGLKDEMVVPSGFDPIRRHSNRCVGKIRIGRIDLTSKKLVSPVARGVWKGLVWRNSSGDFGMVRSNPASWYYALPFVSRELLIPSSEWVPHDIPKSDLLSRDKRILNDVRDRSGEMVFERLRKILPPEKTLTADLLYLEDKKHFTSSSLSKLRWHELLDDDFFFDTPYKVHRDKRPLRLELRDPAERTREAGQVEESENVDQVGVPWDDF